MINFFSALFSDSRCQLSQQSIAADIGNDSTVFSAVINIYFRIINSRLEVSTILLKSLNYEATLIILYVGV